MPWVIFILFLVYRTHVRICTWLTVCNTFCKYIAYIIFAKISAFEFRKCRIQDVYCIVRVLYRIVWVLYCIVLYECCIVLYFTSVVLYCIVRVLYCILYCTSVVLYCTSVVLYCIVRVLYCIVCSPTACNVSLCLLWLCAVLVSVVSDYELC